MSKERKISAKMVSIVKTSVYCTLLVSMCMLAIFGASQQVFSEGDSYNYSVVIDAGHGGIDAGVLGAVTKVQESQLNLKVAYLLKEEFESCGIGVVMTRRDNNGLYGNASAGFKRRDMEERKRIIQSSNANMVISVHMNKYPDRSRRGAQVFFDNGSQDGTMLAQKIQQVLNDFSGFDHESLKGDYYILQCTSSPSVIVECGFLSNAEDEVLLSDAKYQAQLARKIFEGAMLYMASSGQVVDTVI